eukprot:TRINITY_DN27093_c0_g1_i1.p1 TRINITY_DN27093_c0_g1~~TRINITY_DN27093_c0_g1_i1.p1  ORF type:complete len:393 (+),score=205.52 TRINITY_DN27093_c0_g1_i1:74-1252(+)
MASDSEDDRFDDVDENEEDSEISNPSVLSKYKDAGEIANRCLAYVLGEVAVGKKVVDICVAGDKYMEEQLAKTYKSTKVEKGIAFPTCISINNVAGHFSPLQGDETTIQDGDVVKVDLGVQIDGFISMAAHTIVAGTAGATGRKADVILAAHYAAEAAHRLIKPGKKNSDVTAAIAKIAEQYKVSPLEGVLSHQLKRYIVDGNNVIINKESLENKVEEFEFEENQVYCVDILMSSGEGKAKELETKTTVYKRAVDREYNLKMKASRYVFNEINQRFPTFPFTLRALDENRGRLGITEMLKHELLYSYPVLFEKSGEFIAQIKFTVMITPTATVRLNGPIEIKNVTSEHKIEDKEILDILAQGTKRAKKNKKNKKKKAPASEQKKEAEPMKTN